MMDKNREAFEAWWEDHCDDVLPTKVMSLAAWNASRQAIEVDAPEVCAFNLCDLVERDKVITYLTSLGIRVKGNEAVMCVACRYKHLKVERIVREELDRTVTLCPKCSCAGFIKCLLNAR